MTHVTTKPGKQATRGEKTIIKENEDTVLFYRNVTILVLAIPVISQLAIYYPKLSTTFYTMHSVSAVIFWCTYQFMKMMARVKHSLQGEVLDCGTDLNMKNGLAEHCKDIIILTSIAIILSVASEWCWLLLLLAPLRALYLFWIHIASPWFFAPAPEVEEISEKKQRRMERKQTKFKRA
ncbi:transmembrane protein 208-like isoform X2 [Watersipora subatra]|uniref:transmembrane protein 208-like isoform X2 n=1 Tax=Watersipora subatra TaxID=2589382 RepID=UPI00355B6A29